MRFKKALLWTLLFSFILIISIVFQTVYKTTYIVDLTGEYKIEGSNYSGTVTIAKQGKKYEARWKINDNVFKGVGIRDKNRLIFSINQKGGDIYALVKYQILDDKK